MESIKARKKPEVGFAIARYLFKRTSSSYLLKNSNIHKTRDAK